MTTLQIFMAVLWITIIFGFIFSIGNGLGGTSGGMELIMSVLLTICLYSAIGAIIYYSIKAVAPLFT